MDALAAWREHDLGRAIHAADRAAIDETAPFRALVLDLLAEKRPRDLFNACAQLGRMLHAAGASPSLASTTLDGALVALGQPLDPAIVGAARASVVEGYAGDAAEAGRVRARAGWEYPACAVEIDGGAMAVACGFPRGDVEALGDWAARTALAISKAGVKEVLLGGDALAQAELRATLEMVGVAVRHPAGDAKSKSKSWIPWRR